MSIGIRDMRARGEEPVWKLEEHPKIPLYFWRAAINAAIGLARSYQTSFENWQEKAKQGKGVPSQAYMVHCSPVLYKWMYREFCEDSIQIKVFNGKIWVWATYPYTGCRIPKTGKMLSPTLKLEKKAAYLYVPIEEKVKDIRTVKERMEQEIHICAVAFPDSDTLAVCAVMKKDGSIVEQFFIHGGKEQENKRKKVLKRLEKSRKSRQMGQKKKRQEDVIRQNKGRQEDVQENAIFYKKLEQINTYYAHKVSREILEYCKAKNIKLIVVPNYETAISFQNKGYLNTNSFRWQGRSMIRNLKYKAYQEEILVTAVYSYHISDCCSECGEKIQRYNEGHKASRNYYGGQLFFCPNGHRGNAGLNTAKNIGIYFLRYSQKWKKNEDG